MGDYKMVTTGWTYSSFSGSPYLYDHQSKPEDDTKLTQVSCKSDIKYRPAERHQAGTGGPDHSTAKGRHW